MQKRQKSNTQTKKNFLAKEICGCWAGAKGGKYGGRMGRKKGGRKIPHT